MSKIIFVLIILLSITACSRFEQRRAASETNASNDTVEEIVSSNQARRYRQHLPPNYASKGALPVIVSLHGYTSNAEQQENVSKMSVKADAENFVAVYPEGLGSPQSWKFGDRAEGAADVAFIRDLIQRLQSKFNIDDKRIYVTGISNGAEMTYRLICDLADTFAAAALVSGGYPPFRDCQPTRPVPIVVFHGTADKLLPYDGIPPALLPVRDWTTSWATRNGCNATPQVAYQKGDVTGEVWALCRNKGDVVLYTIAGKGHSWPGSNMPAEITTHDINATDMMWQFFVAHPKP